MYDSKFTISHHHVQAAQLVGLSSLKNNIVQYYYHVINHVYFLSIIIIIVKPNINYNCVYTVAVDMVIVAIVRNSLKKGMVLIDNDGW